LQKSARIEHIEGVQGGEQMTASAAAPAAVAIVIRQDFAHFQFADDMRTHDPLAGQDPIAVPVPGAQLSTAWFLLRDATSSVSLLQPLIAAIAQALNRGSSADLTAFEELEVMLAFLAYGRAEDLPTGLIDNKLGFSRMAAVLAIRVAALFFVAVPPGSPWHRSQ
jgi:hypothetical protein